MAVTHKLQFNPYVTTLYVNQKFINLCLNCRLLCWNGTKREMTVLWMYRGNRYKSVASPICVRICAVSTPSNENHFQSAQRTKSLRFQQLSDLNTN